MRASFAILPLLLCAGPALAQPVGPAAPPRPEVIQVPPEMQSALADPATADRLAGMMQAMSKAFLNLPVGEIQAAAEGRPPTRAERHMTLRDAGRRDDPNFDRNFQQQMANTRPMIRQSMKALSEALPAMMQGLEQAGQALDRAAANMPDPTYPKR